MSRAQERITFNVNTLRTIHDTTQVQLAKVLGISQPAVHKKLTGITSWSVEDLEALSDFWNVPLAGLLSDPGSTSMTAPYRANRNRKLPRKDSNLQPAGCRAGMTLFHRVNMTTAPTPHMRVAGRKSRDYNVSAVIHRSHSLGGMR